ncbi:MAG: hypothetical protein F4Z52_11335, partial [Gammaproteobacteria bacterium]|nr:hypothetical protein [Gammaproteobacteria bacterium]
MVVVSPDGEFSPSNLHAEQEVGQPFKYRRTVKRVARTTTSDHPLTTTLLATELLANEYHAKRREQLGRWGELEALEERVVDHLLHELQHDG